MPQINDTYFIRYADRSRHDVIETNLLEGLTIYSKTYPAGYQTFDSSRDRVVFNHLVYVLRTLAKTSLSGDEKAKVIDDTYRTLRMTDEQREARKFGFAASSNTRAASNNESSDAARTAALMAKYTNALNALIKFFSEFHFSPSYRFVNSLVRAKDPKVFVENYFKIQDHQHVGNICDKLKSAEFRNIIRDLSGATPKPINTRFEVYFGDPGAGKTVKACSEATDHRCIVCSSDMLPSDLMQNFCFKDGKADFDPSDLWLAIENGWTIVLDEVNMLPFESLRFLQGITDGKESINFKGHVIKFHPDFKIIATMNLNVDGRSIPLPAPLVDRAYDICEFKLSAADLINAVM